MIRFESFEKLGVAVAAMSDRSDGDCGLRSGDPVAAGDAREHCCAQCGVKSDGLVCVRQVHGAEIIRVGEALGTPSPTQAALAPPASSAPTAALPEADGLIANVRGFPLAVFVADCVPVYLFDTRTGAGGLVHAGREGTLHNISSAAVAALTQAWNTRAEDIHALIGPAAGPCCYEVSPAMAAAFVDAGLPVQGRYLDLWEANARQLEWAGVPRNQIEVTGICTICDTRFHSYRRDNTARRNMALLVL